jgi:uncharacterized membrane protein YdbT with pleckstrin-like domain
MGDFHQLHRFMMVHIPLLRSSYMPIILYPHRRYLYTQWFGIAIGAPLQFALFYALLGMGGSRNGLFISVIGILVGLIATFSLVASILNYRSIRYEITEDEIVVYSGVLNKTIKHVPFRTITNMQVIRRFWDRLFGLGILEIQTAGTGLAKAEERLVGLSDVQGTYEYVANVLRRFRTALSPTQTTNEQHGDNVTKSERDLLVQILNELRLIRKELRQPNRTA